MFKGLPPRPTRVEVPGWGGAATRAADGAAPRPWHCQPFADAAAYGLELRYPFETECRVRADDGRAVFEGDFHGESPWQEPGQPDAPPPFTAFALVPERVTYDITPLGPAQRARRERLDDAVARASHVATHRWRDAAGRRFDNRYKVLRKIFTDGGWRAVLRAVRREDAGP